MIVRINDVRVGDRHRKDMGDLSNLAHSIAEVGLLHPIVVTQDCVLIAGERRIEACRLLGWDTIEATIAANLNEAMLALKAERDENTCRKDFAPSEAVAMADKLEPFERQAAKERSGTRTDLEPVENFSAGRALDHWTNKRNPAICF